ncbi:tyrosine-type recombinase/integrase [Niveispirillum sp. KHB5.9]|uniref:tyrosine-type recombinase/integrase n=1 Tax=Niveispirillum sp. KHB5.9 TaxID=3400269 RepID=UPI003A8C3C48
MTIAKITLELMNNPPAIPVGKRRVRVYDSEIKGLSVEFRPKKKASFRFRYFDQYHREQMIGLGRFGAVTITQVRERAQALRAGVSLGQDPAAEKRQRRAIPTVAKMIEETVLPELAHQRGAGNHRAYAARIVQAFGKLRLDELTPTDIISWRLRLVKEGLANATANRHIAFLRMAFNRAIERGLFSGSNPAKTPRALPENNREQYLTVKQVQALVGALDLEPNRDAAGAILLLLLTGARRNEVTQARWSDVNFELNLLTVQRSKSGRRHHIPLSSPAVSLLRMQQQRTGQLEHVFPGRVPGKPITSLRGAWSRARQMAGLSDDFVLHSLRHTYASCLVNRGRSLDEVAVVLGHSQLSTTRRYAHHAPDRLVSTATLAAETWGFLPAMEPRTNIN